MTKLDEFNLIDTFDWSRREILREGLNAAKRHGEYWPWHVRAVSIKDVISQEYEGKQAKVYTFVIWGHEYEVPLEYRPWWERLEHFADRLTTGDAWTGED